MTCPTCKDVRILGHPVPCLRADINLGHPVSLNIMVPTECPTCRSSAILMGCKSCYDAKEQVVQGLMLCSCRPEGVFFVDHIVLKTTCLTCCNKKPRLN